MHKQRGKKTTLIGMLALFSIGVVFAKSYKFNIVENINSAKTVGREYLKKDSSTVIMPMSNAVAGEWIARDDHKEVIIECERSGTMEIEWKQGFTRSTEWHGKWTATDTELTLTILTKETTTWENGFKKETRENIHAVWKIQYTRTGNTLTVSGQDLPKELRDLTLFWEED